MTSDARPSGRHLPYQPALDGIRGLAVAAVVLFHAGVGWAEGGWLGVDAFFVLSGFLITSLLLREWQGAQRLDLRRFWVRRARRLLPALFLVVAAVCLYAATLAEGAQLTQIRRDGVAALFYVANWHFIAEESSYFDLFATPSPFQHVWSLAIEEQWYLVWPVLVAVVVRLRRTSRSLLWVSLALAGTSAVVMAVTFGRGDADLAYYGTHTRAQSLLVGSAAAAALLSGLRVPDWFARLVPMLGLALLAPIGLVWATSDLLVDTWLYRGGFLLLALAVAAVIVAAVQPGPNPLRSVLSIAPLRQLGVVSYGVYLWHWPLFIIVSRDRALLEDASWGVLTAVRITATLAVSLASFHLVERPIRHGWLGRHVRLTPVLAPVAAVTLVAGLLVSTAGAPAASGTDELVLEGLPTRDDLAEGLDTGSRPIPANDDPAATRVLVVGDSVAYSMAGGFTQDIQRSTDTLVWNQTVLFCELAEGARRENGQEAPPSSTCDGWQEVWAANVAEFEPHVPVLQVGAWEIFDRKLDGEWVAFGSEEFDEYFLGLLDEAIDALSRSGATVVLLTSPHFDRRDNISAREWTQNETWRTSHVNQLFTQAVAGRDDALLVDLGRWICPDDCIDDLVTGDQVREDGVHFTDEGAEAAALWLAPQFRALGLTATAASIPPVPAPLPDGTTGP